MQGLFEELNKDGALNDLDVDKEEWLDQLGLFDLSNGKISFLDLNQTPITTLQELLMTSLSYMEFINDIIARCDKRKRDAEGVMEYELNKSIASKGLKLNEAKASAKSTEEYLKTNYRYNSLAAYLDYLKRYLETIEKYHYAVKNRIQALQGIKEKYGNS